MNESIIQSMKHNHHHWSVNGVSLVASCKTDFVGPLIGCHLYYRYLLLQVYWVYDKNPTIVLLVSLLLVYQHYNPSRVSFLDEWRFRCRPFVLGLHPNILSRVRAFASSGRPTHIVFRLFVVTRWPGTPRGGQPEPRLTGTLQEADNFWSHRIGSNLPRSEFSLPRTRNLPKSDNSTNFRTASEVQEA
jgi:hypothetical protein